MKAFIQLAGIALLLVALIVGRDACYVVTESDQAILTQFGAPVGEPVGAPGIHFKLPVLQKANYFDKRFLEWDGDPNQITTEDKRFIWADAFARWRISDPLLFFQRLRDERGAQSRLDDLLDGATRSTIAKHELLEVVRSSNRTFAVSSDSPEAEEKPKNVEFGRTKLEAEVLANARARSAGLGIEILDFRFKRIDYEERVRQEVYTRMISERQRIAEEYRSEGAGEAARIAGDKERELKTIESDAYRKSQEIRGKADAEAADIFAKAYNKDPEFYSFLKTLDVYKTSIGPDTTLILGTDGEFLRYIERDRIGP
jgi:membrane protease subunit HflC